MLPHVSHIGTCHHITYIVVTCAYLGLPVGLKLNLNLISLNWSYMDIFYINVLKGKELFEQEANLPNLHTQSHSIINTNYASHVHIKMSSVLTE
jgi:hypothetical protein